jgi:hypothetical protein
MTPPIFAQKGISENNSFHRLRRFFSYSTEMR